MEIFSSDGLKIAFVREGEGEPIILVHGFASNHRTNWRVTDWFEPLIDAGFEVFAMDCRGHGASDKPHHAEAYALSEMAADVLRLLDFLEVERADVMGYSMGARITALLAATAGNRLRSAVLAGVGENLLGPAGNTEAISAALLAPSAAEVSELVPRQYRQFAESQGNDLKALAACIKGIRDQVSLEQLGSISVPTLVVAGEKDTVAGDPAKLAAAIPGAQSAIVPKRDHMLATGDRKMKEAVLGFLRERP